MPGKQRRGGDFARGERTKEAPKTKPDFARGEDKEKNLEKEPDFARGERTKEAPKTQPDFARGEDEEES
jgi:hypothetical protein